MARLLAFFTNAFPLWVCLGGALALLEPAWFVWFGGPWILWGLAMIMLGMGLTLSPEDFRGLRTMPRMVLLGLVAQYTITPLLGWSIGRLLSYKSRRSALPRDHSSASKKSSSVALAACSSPGQSSTYASRA